jgi:class 3 adenylate cyclase
MVAERALPMATSIQNILLSDLEVQIRIGATVGNAYCGARRWINAARVCNIGTFSNLAARLMDSLKGPGMVSRCNPAIG